MQREQSVYGENNLSVMYINWTIIMYEHNNEIQKYNLHAFHYRLWRDFKVLNLQR